MIGSNGFAYVIDFGTSIFETGLAFERARVLTAEYEATSDTAILTTVWEMTIGHKEQVQASNAKKQQAELDRLIEEYPSLRRFAEALTEPSCRILDRC